MNLNAGADDAVRPLLVGYDDAARLLGIGRRTLERLAADAAIPSVAVGSRKLFRLRDLESWVDTRVTTEPSPSSDLH